MAELPRQPQRGDDILYAFNALRDFVRKERVTAGVGLRMSGVDGGKTLSLASRGGGSGGQPPTDPRKPGGEAAVLGHTYSFEAFANDDLDGIVMETGDIYLGPLTWILWADIDGVTTTPTVSATDTHVWLEVRQDTGTSTGSIGAGYAWMKYGTKAAMLAALDAGEQMVKCVVPLVETVWAAGVITKVKNLQCGDSKIFRAAG
jgi:hypothetical protein